FVCEVFMYLKVLFFTSSILLPFVYKDICMSANNSLYFFMKKTIWKVLFFSMLSNFFFFIKDGYMKELNVLYIVEDVVSIVLFLELFLILVFVIRIRLKGE
ncbi:hypothetical protein P2H47_13365, partial [Mannheimia haemolytica]|nr:hypothetical protein [Mannheimia haemolytica]